MSDLSSSFDALPAPPTDLPDACNVLARLVEGLGFRYRWAVDGLGAEDMDFRAAEGCMSLGQLLDHLRFLARWVERNVVAAAEGTEPVTYPSCCEGLPDPAGDPAAFATQTLGAWASLRDQLLRLDAAGLARVQLIGGKEPTAFPVWNMINGPLADALTHVGQLNAWRRQLGKPGPRHDVFRGRPPRPSGG